jgi:hypothetical protein
LTPARPTRTALRAELLEARDVPSAVTLDADPPTAAVPAGDPAAGDSGAILSASAPSVADTPLRALPRGRFAVASGLGQATQVNIYDSATNALIGTLTPFGRDFTGGAHVATADLTGDHVDDIIVGAGPGSAPWVKVFDGVTLTEVRSFLAYSESFRGGVFVAAGDVTGDGRADLVTGAGPGGGPHVEVFDGKTLFPDPGQHPVVVPAPLEGFFAYDPDFHGGVSVAVGDVNGDGVADIVTGAGPGGGPHVKAFRAADLAVLESFFAYDPGFRGGVFVTAGDTDGDGRAEIATGPMAGGGPDVRVFSGGAQVADFWPFDGSLRCGVDVALRDVDGDGWAELIAATGPGVAPEVRVLALDTGEVMRDFPALTPDYTGGLSVG